MASTPFLTPVFIFGSIRGGSGKSSVVAHLSVYLQSKGKRVAIIDANAAFPNQLRSVLPRSISLECYTDLTELVIEGSSRFRRTFVFTATDKISYFPSFKLKDPVRLLSDASLRDFFLQLRSHFDVVLVNLSPGCEHFVVAETFIQRRGHDAGAPAAVLVTNTDVRSLTLLDSMLRTRPALFHFARERLMFIYNMLPRGIEDTTIDKARLGWTETRRLFRLPISLGISMIDEFAAQPKSAAPIVLQDKSLLRQTMATLSRTLFEVAEGQWQGDSTQSDSDDFAPCLDSFLLEKLNRHIEPLQGILARSLCTHGATISTYIESSPSAYRFRIRLSGVGRRSLPPVLDIHYPMLKAVTDGKIPTRFALDLEYAPSPIEVQSHYLEPSISAKPLYHFDDRFASKCRFDIYSEECLYWRDTPSEREPEWRGYIPPADLPSLTQLLGYQQRRQRLDAYIYQRTEIFPEIRPLFEASEFVLCTTFTCRGELTWEMTDQSRDHTPRVWHDSCSIPSCEILKQSAGPVRQIELPALVRNPLPLVSVVAPIYDEPDDLLSQIVGSASAFHALNLDAPYRPHSYFPEERRVPGPEITRLALHRSLALKMDSLSSEFSTFQHECPFHSDEIAAAFRSLKATASFRIHLRQMKRTDFFGSSPLPNELGLTPVLSPRRFISPEISLTPVLPPSFRINYSAACRSGAPSEPEAIGRLISEPSVRRAVMIIPPQFEPPKRFGMAPFLITLALPEPLRHDLPYTEKLPPNVYPPSPSIIMFQSPRDTYGYRYKKDTLATPLLKRLPGISILFKPMTWSFLNLEFSRISSRPVETRSVFPAAWSEKKVNVFCGMHRLHSEELAITDIEYSGQCRLLRLPVLQLISPAGEPSCAPWCYSIIDVGPVRNPKVCARVEFRNLYTPDNQFPLPDFGKRPKMGSPDLSVCMPARPLAIAGFGVSPYVIQILEFPISSYQPPEIRIHEITEPPHFSATFPSVLNPSSKTPRLPVADAWNLLQVISWGDAVSRVKLPPHKHVQPFAPDISITTTYTRPVLSPPGCGSKTAFDQFSSLPRLDHRKFDRQLLPPFYFAPAPPEPLLKRVFPLELIARRKQLPYSTLSGIDILYSCLMDLCRRSLYKPIEFNEARSVRKPRLWRDKLGLLLFPSKMPAHEIDSFYSCTDRILDKPGRGQAIMVSRVKDLREAINLTQASVDRLTSPTPS